jgi:hypothetical protein
VQQGLGVGCFGGAEGGEQVSGVPAGADRGDVVGGSQRVPHQQRGAGLAVAVAGGAVQIGGASAVLHRRGRIAGGEVNLEQGGQRLAGDDPVVAVRRVGGGVLGEGERAVEVAEPQVTRGEAGERDELGVRGLGVAGQSTGSLVVGEGVSLAAEPAPDRAERVERAGLDRAVAGLDGECRRLHGDLQCAVLLAEIQQNDRENAQRLGLGATVARLAVRLPVAPQLVDQRRHAHRPPTGGRQHREQRPRPRAADVDPVAADDHLERAENPYFGALHLDTSPRPVPAIHRGCCRPIVDGLSPGSATPAASSRSTRDDDRPTTREATQ